jgi:hypothetical protein
MPYDPENDFVPISLLTRAPNLLVVHPALPVKSVKELIALAKARPGELNYGAGAIGASTYMASEMFKHMAGVKLVFVPYKSSGAAVTAIVSGELQVMFASTGGASPHVKSGRLRAARDQYLAAFTAAAGCADNRGGSQYPRLRVSGNRVRVCTRGNSWSYPGSSERRSEKGSSPDPTSEIDCSSRAWNPSV